MKLHSGELAGWKTRETAGTRIYEQQNSPITRGWSSIFHRVYQITQEVKEIERYSIKCRRD